MAEPAPADIAPKTTSAPRLLDRRLVLDVAVVAILALLAILVRWPYLQTLPLLSDESAEALRALSISHGETFHLVNVSNYLGALPNYMLAAVYLIFGHEWQVPRLFVLVMGSLTPPMVYVLARAFLGRWPSALAGGLMVTSPWHIIVDSHVAYANSLTPLFAAATMACAAWSLRKKSAPGLVAVGALLGVTIQTHTTSAALGAGLALLLVARPHRQWLRRPWPYLAVVALAIANANLLVFNLLGATHMGSADTVGALGAKFGLFSGGVSIRSIPENLGRAALVVTGMIDSSGNVDVGAVPGVPLVPIYSGLAAYGMLMLARRRHWLPLSVVGTAIVGGAFLMAATSHVPMFARYFLYVLPAAFVGLAAGVEDIGRRLRSLRVPGVAVTALSIIVVAFPLVTVWQAYSGAVRAGRTNAAVIELSQHLATWKAADSHAPVLIDRRIGGQYGRGSQYTLAGVLSYLLTMEDVSPTVGRVSRAAITDSLAASGGPVIAVAPAGAAARLAGKFSVQVLAREHVPIRFAQNGDPSVEVLLLSPLAAQHTSTSSPGPEATHPRGTERL